MPELKMDVVLADDTLACIEEEVIFGFGLYLEKRFIYFFFLI